MKPNFTEITALHGLIPYQTRLAGLDIGTKTIGIAISDRLRSIASPLQTLNRTKLSKDLVTLRTIITEQDISAFIIGYPMNMDGTEGPRCQATRQIARDIQTTYSLPVVLWDERMSSVAAERAMLQGDLTRQRRHVLIDKMAASYILQGALDRLNKLPTA